MMSNATPLLHSNPHVNTTVDIDAVMNKVSTVFLTIIILLGTTGNSVVIWVARFRMKPNVTNVFLVNLAVADLIFCLTQISWLIKDIFFDYWPFGLFVCKFNGFFKYANMFCSVFLLAVISVDRALCVWRPVFTRKRRKICAARLISVGVWITAGIFSSPYFVYRQIVPDKKNLSQCLFKVNGTAESDNAAKYAYYFVRFICGFLLPFLVIFICYTLAAIGIRRTRLSGKSRPLHILAVLVCAFFLCWAPYHFLRLVRFVDEDNEVVKLGWRMVSDLTYLNSCINPVLYLFVGLDVRQLCKQSLFGIFHRALTEEAHNRSQLSTREESCNSFPKAAGVKCVNRV
ncbi:C3a anaphylatoxin chemotactic receptor-like [Danio aesculapii]|uniref:C3a anaphylatoxin chemotactic receptor-like n=1 Tax=Danio aesculapii TaxID=1142201 RepID=UPI0024BF2EF0|nr:C3a anaphylatoxin chemotactic receptor-like [Danio aesculapii]